MLLHPESSVHKDMFYECHTGGRVYTNNCKRGKGEASKQITKQENKYIALQQTVKKVYMAERQTNLTDRIKGRKKKKSYSLLPGPLYIPHFILLSITKPTTTSPSTARERRKVIITTLTLLRGI